MEKWLYQRLEIQYVIRLGADAARAATLETLRIVAQACDDSREHGDTARGAAAWLARWLEKRSAMIKLLLVDDQPAVRQGLRMRLALEADLAVVGEAGDGRAALALAAALAPDVVLMDVALPEMDGIAVTEALLAAAPERAVVMLSLYDDAVTRARARAAGACTFVAKQDGVDALLAAVRHAATPQL